MWHLPRAEALMRSERVFTNLTCNQNCTFCTSRASTDDRAFIRGDAVKGRINAAHAAGAKEIVLTGGEPALRKDIAELVAHARAQDLRVVLETNATAIDSGRAQALASAGLSLARVNVIGLVDPVDSVTRDEGGAERTLAGVKALIAAGIPLEFEAAIVTSTLTGLPDLPAKLTAELGNLRQIKGMLLRVPVESPDTSELVAYEDAAKTISALEDSARRAQLQLHMAPDSGPPPCVFKHQARVAHLYSLTPGATRRSDHVQVDACSRCQMADRCSGLPKAYLSRHEAPPMHPIGEDRMRRRLSLIGSVEEQIRREFVTLNRYENASGPVIEKIIRVNFHCNQSCRFCFVSTHLPTESQDSVSQAIIEAAAEGVRITLSGGEPTLNPNLIEYIKLAKSHSKMPINLQTNATRMSDLAYVQSIIDAGVDEAFVSLHGSTAEISDAVTEAPGTFDKTVVGLDNLHKTGVQLTLNFVICQKNLYDMVPYVQFCATRWPRAYLNISFVAPSSDVVPKEAALIPKYSDALPQLALAVAEAHKLKMQIGGFESMCGLPLCLVPTELNHFMSLTDIPEGFDGGEFVKTPTCKTCALEAKCYGLRRGYLELHGHGELISIGRAGAA
jgi:MoaA/NifB/PqqE/SkfB family radical SAM enzyme